MVRLAANIAEESFPLDRVSRLFKSLRLQHWRIWNDETGQSAGNKTVNNIAVHNKNTIIIIFFHWEQ